MLPNAEKCRQTMHDVDVLLEAVFRISVNTQGRLIVDRRLEVASTAFAKVYSHAHAARQLAPRGPLGGQAPAEEFWNIGSMAVLARTVLESYYTMFYIAVDDVSEELRDFRWLLWDYHTEFHRLRQLLLVRSVSKEMQNIESEVHKLKISILEHPVYIQQSSSIKKKIRAGDLGIFSTNTELSKRAVIDPDYYQFVYRFLSSYSHAHPFSMAQLRSFEGGTQEGLNLINVVLTYCIVYICLTLRDFVKLVPDQSAILTGEAGELVEVWTGVVSDFTKSREVSP